MSINLFYVVFFVRDFYNETMCIPCHSGWAADDKAEFLATMSHEIRTLMNSVIGFGDLLKKTSLSEQQKEYVDAINESGAKLISIVNDMLDSSRIQSEKLAYKEGEVGIVTPLEESEESIRGVSVLVVEDNALNQKLLLLLLTRMGCIIEIANNGHEAVLKATSNNFEIILMDIQMPIMDGLEAAEFLRTKMKVTTPIIAITAKVSKEDDEKCIAAGMNDFLTKPIELDILKKKIIKWAKKQKQAQSP